MTDRLRRVLYEDPHSLPLVDREAEVAGFREVWQGAVDGRGALVLVGGAAGIGKSRIVLEVAELADVDGADVRFGEAIDGGETTPFAPFIQALVTEPRGRSRSPATRRAFGKRARICYPSCRGQSLAWSFLSWGRCCNPS